MKKYGLAVFLLLSIAQVCEGQPVGDCEHGDAEAFLDVNNVRAAVYNNGNLFRRGRGNAYTVPKSGTANAIFVSQFWIGGMVGGEIRLSASDYGPGAFWPGPLGEDGAPPADCEAFDRIFELSRSDLTAYAETGVPPANVRRWPAELGAPVIDGDGFSGNYNLDGGDRPALLGDQMLWWVMNDRGNAQFTPRKNGNGVVDAVGVEVRATAFAFRDLPDIAPYPERLRTALYHTTFYRYEVTYRGEVPLEDAWMAFFTDTDLGNATDDFVGSDSLLGLGFVYQGDDFDDYPTGYGSTPVALGVDFMKGPIIVPDGRDNDYDGKVDEAGERGGMEVFWEYDDDWVPSYWAEDRFSTLHGRWYDGTPITVGGHGYGGSTPTTFMYSGNPPNFWSEENFDGEGAGHTPSDRRIMMSTGPMRLEPGETRELLVGIVWSQSVDRLSAVYQLKMDNAIIQSVFDELIQPRLPKRDAPVSRRYVLVHNHPNPVTDLTTIVYELPQEEHVELGIYDALGRRVAVLVDGVQPPGEHRAEFDAEGVAPGVYFYRLEAGLVSGARMMVVLPK